MINEMSGRGYDVASMWQNLFNKLDQNGNSSIDKIEMESIVSENGPSVEDIFSKLDTDQDGVIGQTEYEDALSKLRTQQPPPHGPPPQGGMGPDPEEMFNNIDRNGDGSISKDELTLFMAQNTSDVDQIFSEVDTDGDGVISRSESDAHMEKMQEEKKGGPPQDLAMNAASEGQSWESMMIEKLLSAYDVVSNESADLTSRYV